MASRDFGLVKYEFKRADGKGKVYTAFQTPSVLIRATQLDTDNPFEGAGLMAFYAAKANKILAKMGYTVDDDPNKSDMDRALEFLDVYQFREVPLDDDGHEISPEEAEPDPTEPRSRASDS